LLKFRFVLQTKKPIVFEYAGRLSIQKSQLRSTERVTYNLLKDAPLEFIKNHSEKARQSLETGGNDTGFAASLRGSS